MYLKYVQHHKLNPPKQSLAAFMAHSVPELGHIPAGILLRFRSLSISIPFWCHLRAWYHCGGLLSVKSSKLCPPRSVICQTVQRYGCYGAQDAPRDCTFTWSGHGTPGWWEIALPRYFGFCLFNVTWRTDLGTTSSFAVSGSIQETLFGKWVLAKK